MALLSPLIGFLVLSCINVFETQKQVFYSYLCRLCWLLVYWSLEQEKLFKGWQGNASQWLGRFLPLLLIRFLQTPIQVCKSKQVHTGPRKLFTGWQVNAARQVCAVKSSNGTTSGPPPSCLISFTAGSEWHHVLTDFTKWETLGPSRASWGKN